MFLESSIVVRQQVHVILCWEKYKKPSSLFFLLNNSVIQLSMKLFLREVSYGTEVDVGMVKVDDLEEIFGILVVVAFSFFCFRFHGDCP